jgi:DNA processing protein
MPADPQDEHAALVALLWSLPKGARWGTVSERVLERGSAVDVWAEDDERALIASPERAQTLVEAAGDLDQWRSAGWRFLSILDQDYPARVRDGHQAPSFLFASGHLVPYNKAIAVVGDYKSLVRRVFSVNSFWWVFTTLWPRSARGRCRCWSRLLRIWVTRVP